MSLPLPDPEAAAQGRRVRALAWLAIAAVLIGATAYSYTQSLTSPMPYSEWVKAVENGEVHSALISHETISGDLKETKTLEGASQPRETDAPEARLGAAATRARYTVVRGGISEADLRGFLTKHGVSSFDGVAP
ncbi:MAG: hypothetical protein ACYS22_10000, partial [Planctomycetota bacterium]